MSIIVANASFSYRGTSFTHGVSYDTASANGDINLANTNVPHMFYATAGTKTCTNTFLMRDTRAGGLDRYVHVGELLPSNDAAVTAAPGNFR